MMSTQFCHIRLLDHMMLQPRRLLEAYGDMNSENEHKADPGNIDSNIIAEVT